MPRIYLAITALLLAVACDPPAPAANQADTKVAPDGKASAAPPAAPPATPPAAPGTFATLSECIDSCGDAKLTPTDRATCRLNCDTAFRPKLGGDAAPADANPVAQAAECLGRCYAAGGTLGPCTAACKASAAGLAAPPAPELIDALDACVRTCHGDKAAQPTDRKTCELNCAQTTRAFPISALPPPPPT